MKIFSYGNNFAVNKLFTWGSRTPYKNTWDCTRYKSGTHLNPVPPCEEPIKACSAVHVTRDFQVTIDTMLFSMIFVLFIQHFICWEALLLVIECQKFLLRATTYAYYTTQWKNLLPKWPHASAHDSSAMNENEQTICGSECAWADKYVTVWLIVSGTKLLRQHNPLHRNVGLIVVIKRWLQFSRHRYYRTRTNIKYKHTRPMEICFSGLCIINTSRFGTQAQATHIFEK